MKRIFILLAALAATAPTFAQITITSAEMPVAEDTLRYSIANAFTTTIDLNDTGTGKVWDFSALAALSQSIDTYKTPLEINPLYLFSISSSAVGERFGNLPIPAGTLPVTVTDIYTFFKTSSSAYNATDFAASISGFPTPVPYTTPDRWFSFPLTYMTNDSANYYLNFSIPSLGGIQQIGYRKSRVDAWGTIVTPFYTTPTACIRDRSEINEIDSVTFSGTTIGLPRNMVEYKWMVNGSHYPALWVTTTIIAGTEIVSNIKYKDVAREMSTGVINTKPAIYAFNAYPNPAVNGTVTLDIPANWTNFYTEVYDMQSRLVLASDNTRVLNITALPKGNYAARVTSGNKTAYIHITK